MELTRGQLRRQTIITKLMLMHGISTEEAEELYLEKQRSAGRAGGSTPTEKPKGFASMDKEKHSAASRRGGSVKKK